jgi:Tfp pilus assembly protein PilZ
MGVSKRIDLVILFFSLFVCWINNGILLLSVDKSYRQGAQMNMHILVTLLNGDQKATERAFWARNTSKDKNEGQVEQQLEIKLINKEETRSE